MKQSKAPRLLDLFISAASFIGLLFEISIEEQKIMTFL